MSKISSDPPRERALEGALFRLYERWWRELKPGWRAEKFRQMIDSGCERYRGGVWTVRHLLYTRETTGFSKLRNHPELTVESLVLNGDWDDIFDDYDRRAASQKLGKDSK